ncbi:MAG TPA: carboxypeptidase-like regulatory domain-containing protein [Arenicellales bacterium]|nr:carboxypeptidase-like regulatory domain-containing protein [Arenicellales bacterium]
MAATIATGLLLAGCGGGSSSSAGAGSGSGGTATVSGVVDNGDLASLESTPGTRHAAYDNLLPRLASWISEPAHAAPVAGAEVVLVCDSGFTGTDITDSDGIYEITGVPADDSCSLEVDGSTATVVETSANTVINVDVTISPGGSGDGTVVVQGTVDDGTGTNEDEETSLVPSGHFPPPGECKLWFVDREPGHQPPPGDCEEIEARQLELEASGENVMVVRG